MADPLNLVLIARDILATPSNDKLEIIVEQLYHSEEPENYEAALALYDFCVSHFPNCLILKLLMVYRFSPDNISKLQSADLLTNILAKLKPQRFELSLVALHEIKPLLVSCLKMEATKQSDTTILRIIVFLVADHVMNSEDGGWEELSDCILSLANSNPIRAFNVFIYMPSLFGEFIYRFLHKFLAEVYKVLLHPELDKVKDWILALKSAVKMGIQLMGSEKRFDITRDILHIVLKSTDEVVCKDMEEEFLQRGLRSLKMFLTEDANQFKWNNDQCRFVAEFAFTISEIGTHTKEAAKKIYQMVTKQEKYVHDSAFELSPSRVENQDFAVESDCVLYRKGSSAVEILRSVASTRMDDRSREIAIKSVRNLLDNHISGKVDINVSEIRELQPLLISCLADARIPESTFKILVQVVFHVARELSRFEKDNWFDLWDYIATECKTDFNRTVYIFRCLTMRLDDKEFVIPAINNLLPEIHKNLNLPSDNSSWVLAFTGAFCAALHLIEISSHAESLKEIAYKMIDSVKYLVERGMEVEVAGSAFIDVESVVEKQIEWYTTNDYRFVKGLLWRLYAMEDMKWECKIVLWRINVILERGVDKTVKQLPENEFDWLNLPKTYLGKD